MSGIPSVGRASLHLGEEGDINHVSYNMDTDGRILFGKQEWKQFHEGKDLQVGQAVLITLWNTNRRNFDVKVVIEII
jgi:hypothetical protein